MQDRSGGQINREDHNLSLLDVYSMTDFTEKEFDHIADMKVGEEFYIVLDHDIYIKRTA